MRQVAIGLLATLLASCASVAPVNVDVLIKGGTVYPGGDEAFTGDVAVRGDRIVAVGPNLRVDAARTIDARGMIVAPGFIDPHTHMTGWLASDDARRRLVEPFLLQGVTTAVIGNDGGGPIEVGKLLDGSVAKPVGINFAAFTGFGTIREAVIGEAKRAPTAEELTREKALVRSAMCEGALGLSTGLFYAPQSFSETAEVIALALVAGEFGGVYDTHLRDESDYTIGLSAAVDETIAIARAARLPVHISHIKALGTSVQGTAPAIVKKIEAARASGLNVTASQYPWEASGTSMVASLVPLWALDGGRDVLLARLADAAQAARVRDGMAENLRRRGGAASLLVVEGPWKGKSLSEIAAATGADPISAAIAVIRNADVAVVSFNMDERDIVTFMRQPWTMTGSDASTGHPRVYGSFARKYAVYVTERAALSLREFIDRSTSVTADFLGLADRGRIKVGKFADIAVFDPATYAANANYEEPERTASGMRTVIVNGRIAVENGAMTGIAAGQALRHRPPPGLCPG